MRPGQHELKACRVCDARDRRDPAVELEQRAARVEDAADRHGDDHAQAVPAREQPAGDDAEPTQPEVEEPVRPEGKLASIVVLVGLLHLQKHALARPARDVGISP